MAETPPWNARSSAYCPGFRPYTSPTLLSWAAFRWHPRHRVRVAIMSGWNAWEQVAQVDFDIRLTHGEQKEAPRLTRTGRIPHCLQSLLGRLIHDLGPVTAGHG